jgi:hypothetical protein
MDHAELDKLRFDYKAAVERWITAIRVEEDARKIAKTARAEYQDALREVLFNF